MEKKLVLEIYCPFCGAEHNVVVLESEYKAWNAGALAQDAFKSLNTTEREQIISHICPTCQKEIFGDTDTGEDEEKVEETTSSEKIIQIHDYTDDTVDVTVPEETRFIHIKVVSGDEIISFFNRDMIFLKSYDSCPGGRSEDIYDGAYVIDIESDEYTEWLERVASYNRFLNRNLH